MIEKDRAIKIGFIQKTHGVKGELSLILNDEVYLDEFDPKFLLLDIDNGLVPFYIESIRIKSNKSILVHLESIDTELKAKDLCGTEVYIETDVIEEKNNISTDAFVGFKVSDKLKGNIGIITEIQEISHNTLFVLDFDGKEILFPINSDFILGINESKKEMSVDLPEGLIDLYLNDADSNKPEEF